MMGSLFSSVSGLKNHTTWMNVIGDNISNVNTVGYKESRVTFKEAISQTLGAASGSNTAEDLGGINAEEMGLGSSLGSIDTIMTQGAIQTTGNSTDVAISGSGFFIAKSGDQTLYTRAGNFSFDNSGNLVASDGALVQGWSRQITRTEAGTMVTITGDTVNTSGLPSNIQIPQNLILGPQATTSNLNPAIKNEGIILSGNLDSHTPANLIGAPGAARPAVGYVPDAVSTATVYDSLGTAHTITFDWTQTSAAPAAQTWSWTAYDTSNGATIGTAANPGTAAIVGNSKANITFNSDGSLATNGSAAPGNQNDTIAFTVANSGALNGAFETQTVSVNLGTPNQVGPPAVIGLRDGITGDYGRGTTDPTTLVYTPKQTVYTSFTDGYSEGTLTGVAVDKFGSLNCSFSNNQIVSMGVLALANFSNPSGLTKAGDTMFVQSANSGLAQVSTAGTAGLGTTTGGALEASNVDLSTELTNMIIAQRGFESNARIVTTSSEMLTTLVQLGR
jgi:flagellar hook protein FlgE